jgi:hypothetical protein
MAKSVSGKLQLVAGIDDDRRIGWEKAHLRSAHRVTLGS